MPTGMWRVVLLYGVALGAGAFLLQWLDYRHVVRATSTEFYVAAIAVIFVLVGVWAGARLTPRPRPVDFTANLAALQSLGISARELEVLTLIAAGDSNKVIARKLALSPNTIKTHLANLFAKLEVSNRTQAVSAARALDILP